MKLRTRTNAIRLRLSQGEVARLTEEGRVEERIFVGPGEDDVLVYRLVAKESASSVFAVLEGRTLIVSVPRGEAIAWAKGEDVGIAKDVPAPGGRTLSILIEKDFACLKPRVGEDDTDAFPNPHETC